MRQILGNLKKYWYLVMAILLLLFVQAYCDLSLPDYTSSIIDVGINGSGVEHPVPEVISAEGYQLVQAFLTEEESKDWDNLYQEDASNYRLISTEKESWESADDEFASVIAVVYMMSQMQNSDTAGMDFSQMSKMTEGMEKMAAMGVDITALTPEMLAMMPEEQREGLKKFLEINEQMKAMGLDLTSPTFMLDLRKQLEDKLSVMGAPMVKSMAKGFAKSQYETCGQDIVKLQQSYMWKTGAKMMAMALVMAVSAIIIGFCASRVGAGVGRDMREKVFKKVIHFSTAELDRFSTASLITRSTNDVQQIQIVTVIMLRVVLYAPILAVGGIINIRKYNSGMNWIIVLAVAAVVSLIAVLLIIAMPKFRQMQDKVDRVNLISREVLTGLPVIRAFRREAREEERFEDANADLTKTMLFVNRAMAFMMPAMMLIMNGVSVLIVWIGAKKIDEGLIQVGALTAFISYSMMIIMGFLMFTMISVLLPRAIVAANRVKEVLDTEDMITEASDAIQEAPSNATIRFEHVSFRYPDGEENALEDIDFVAEPGKTTAIIGSTGSGKSSLVKLIIRLFDVTGGSIQIDGKDIRKLSLKALRGMVGYVPQKGILFSGDIASNIAYGAPGATEENVKEAAEIAQALDFIQEKPDQFKSHIAQGGTNVSGGQKQRLSIARAIARNPKIYIFDDSFSALDFKTDTALRKALEPKTKDATVIIVAQRVSTILNADQIIVLEEGKMIGKGTHKELVESCETYRQIAESQLSEKEFLASIGKDTDGKGAN